MDIWLFIDDYCSSETVVRVITSKNDQFIYPVHKVPLDVFQWLKILFIYFCLPTDLIFAIFRLRNIKSS